MVSRDVDVAIIGGSLAGLDNICIIERGEYLGVLLDTSAYISGTGANLIAIGSFVKYLSANEM